MKKHLAIVDKNTAQEIFNGKKTIETRFSLKKIAPYGQISIGDIVYIKPQGQEIKGQFIVKKVIFLEGLDEKDWQLILKNYSKDILAPKNYFNNKKLSVYGTIIFIGQVEQFIVSPLKLNKKDQRGWVVLE